MDVDEAGHDSSLTADVTKSLGNRFEGLPPINWGDTWKETVTFVLGSLSSL